MHINVNVFGYDLEIKLRKRVHPTPKLIVLPEVMDYSHIESVLDALR